MTSDQIFGGALEEIEVPIEKIQQDIEHGGAREATGQVVGRTGSRTARSFRQFSPF